AERALHPTILFKDTQTGDLRREALAVLRSILDADAEQDDHAAGDLGSPLVIDVHGSRAHPLNDRAQLVAHSNIQGLSPRTTASTSLADRCPGVKTVMLFPSGRRVGNHWIGCKGDTELQREREEERERKRSGET